MTAKTSVAAAVTAEALDRRHDYFIVRDGVECAGLHLLLELWGATHLDDLVVMEGALLDAAHAARAEVIDIHLHHFGTGQGVTGVALLAESHISVHTWPERGYAAIDVFMCGTCDPHAAIPMLERAFRPERSQLQEIKRGIVP